MEKRSRRKFTADFKAKVVIEALKERNSLEEIARKYEIHPNQIGAWKKEFITNAAKIFASGEKDRMDQKQLESLLETLYSQIGQQKVEIEWLKKKLL
jgi:transposase-like protein